MKENIENMKNSIPCGTIEIRSKTDIDKLNDLIEESKKISGVSIPIENKDIPKTPYEYIDKKLKLQTVINPTPTISHSNFMKLLEEYLQKPLAELNMGKNKESENNEY